ncbi:hypothetical protein Nepgr_007570 [Nepenthes gracilis]|uniref:Uncharacterized protein n=1 Tax=Nepenthes gracilis TaxID=150966 RepID=A0AAD3XIJ8_NEPGR|nr:hypothetical protein Nepgr_007570 [Nepenthes gracilis]
MNVCSFEVVYMLTNWRAKSSDFAFDNLSLSGNKTALTLCKDRRSMPHAAAICSMSCSGVAASRSSGSSLVEEAS